MLSEEDVLHILNYKPECLKHYTIKSQVQSVLYIQRFHNLQIRKPDCTTPFYIRDLSIRGFSDPWGVLNPIPLQIPRDHCICLYLHFLRLKKYVLNYYWW